MTRLLIAFATAISLVLPALPASAQGGSIARQLARTGLTQDDINIMTRAGSELYASKKAVVGVDTIWSNPDTSAFGLVEVADVEGNCVTLVYKFQTSKQPSIQSVRLRRCLNDGRWVLTP
ncbi:MAG: hypothetical protein P1U91_01920 [Pseudophaeobacter sp. bin_em_oilr2.035]|uniref:Surface antigen domain-containing protein n=1 Tax=Phaeobacter gallaeciensis TaxID=60890 RepID=A0ABD4XE43_9RHOB|nr:MULTISPECIES: hypothetical protein [Phaeobacter]MDF1770691.1 hypothetical protein [Pseudophaeobacter sp. bin_em_oilr2.035]MDE4146710.1 hypothetical protein [Phaeobacter gallaeciensis]MDE4159383.1 hypothetical protein [Phaeobacter gallaeciensis]MDE4163502.1 hypothetical protein [Phaeobacter gallaeciensis]MDE4167792.1 hypothetical protein [Phaeobacter gallaeciensis]